MPPDALDRENHLAAMLLFLDDSYESTENGYRYVLGGFAVSEPGHRELVAALRDVKARRFYQDRNLTAEEREAIWQDHFIVGADPMEVELKASLLLSSSILKRRRSIALTIATEVLTALKDTGATIHAATAEPRNLRPGMTPGLLAILDSVQSAYREEVLVALDGTNPKADRALARQFAKTMLSPEGRERFPTVAPVPFILDTHASPGLQMADLVAHILLHRARPPELRKPLETLDRILKGMEKNLAGEGNS